MGQVELVKTIGELHIHSAIWLYGNAATEALCYEVANDIATQWNEPHATVIIKRNTYKVRFFIKPVWNPALTPTDVYENTDPRNNYFRIEDFSGADISFVDGIGSNTGYFKMDNLLNHSTTAAHEYGHTIGLYHPTNLDIRGSGVPGIMYPRGTLVDAAYQYNPAARLGEAGHTMNPFTRKVLQKDIDALRLDRLSFNDDGKAILGEFTSVWHDAHLPGMPSTLFS